MRTIRMAAAVLMLMAASFAATSATTAGASTTVTPRVAVYPSTGLARGDVIWVAGSGLQPYQSVDLIQCERMSGGLEGCPASKTVTADSRGRVLTRFRLEDPVNYDVGAGGGINMYCRADHCRILMSYENANGDREEVQSRELQFIGSPATIKVTPSTNLRFKQWVKVSGTAYGAKGHVVKVWEDECYDLVQDTGCEAPLAPRWTRVRSDGTWSVVYRVQRVLPTEAWPSGYVDCAGPLDERLGSCQMVVAVLDSNGRPDKTFGVSSVGEPHGWLEFAAQ